MLALISKTDVKEDTRTQNTAGHFYFPSLIRQFNQLSLDRSRGDKPDPIKRAWLHCVRGAYLTKWLSDYIDSFLGKQ